MRRRWGASGLTACCAVAAVAASLAPTAVADETTTTPPTTTATPTSAPPPETTTATTAPSTTTAPATVTASTAGGTFAPPEDPALSADHRGGRPEPSDRLVAVRPVAVYSTSNSGLAALAVDGNPGTEFVTQMAAGSPPTWAWLTADLGEQVPLRRIEWTFTVPGSADRFWIEVSNDARIWTPLHTTQRCNAGSRDSIDVATKARLVRFWWRNPKGDAQLGHLGDVRFLAASGFVQGRVPVSPSVGELHSRGEATLDRPTSPERIGNRYVVKGSRRSSNSADQSSRWALDGDQRTSWATSMSVAPRTGWVLYDLGNTVPLATVRWTFAKVGFADSFLVQYSNDGQRWTTLAARTNAPATGVWERQPAGVNARFVRFFFNNPNGDANVGYLAEVRFDAA